MYSYLNSIYYNWVQNSTVPNLKIKYAVSKKKRLLQEADNLVLIDGRVESSTQFTMLGQKPPLQETIDNASTFADIANEYISSHAAGNINNAQSNTSGPYEKTGTDVKYKMAIYNYPQFTQNNVFPGEVTNDLRMGTVTIDKYLKCHIQSPHTNQFKYSCDYFNGSLTNTIEQCGINQKGWQWGRTNANLSNPTRFLFTGSRAKHWSSDLLSINAYPSVWTNGQTDADHRFAQVVRPPSATSFMYYRFTTASGNISRNVSKYNTTSFFLQKADTDLNQPVRSLYMVRFGRLSLPIATPVATNIDDLGAHYLIFDTKDCRLVHGFHNPKINYIDAHVTGGSLKGEIVDRIHYEDYPNGWVRITMSTKEWHDGVLVAGLQVYGNTNSQLPQGYTGGTANVGVMGESMIDVAKRWLDIWREVWNKEKYTFINDNMTNVFNNATVRNNFLSEYRSKVQSTTFPYAVGPYITCNAGWWMTLKTDQYIYSHTAPVYKYQDYSPKDEIWQGRAKSGQDLTFNKYSQMSDPNDRPTKLTLLITLRFEHTKYEQPSSGGMLMQWPYIPEKPRNDCYYLPVRPSGLINDGSIKLNDGEDHTIVFVLDRDVNPANSGSNIGQWPIYYRGKKHIAVNGPYPSLYWFMRGRTNGEYIKEFAIWERVLSDNEIFSLIEE